MEQTPAVMGMRGSHDALRRALERHRPCKVLDIPAGEGPISQFLHERGWEVHAADIDPGHFLLRDKLPFQIANLNRPLPWGDASFDAIVCANALQRLYNPGGAILEFARMLRPGGTLFISVNNYASIERRLRFLFCGSINTAINESDVHQTIADPEARVRNCLLYPQIANHLAAAGFEVLAVERSAVRGVHRALAPLAWLVKLGSLLLPPSRRKRDHVGVTASSAILPGGDYVFIEAVK